MKEEKEQYKTRLFAELSTNELNLIFYSLVAYKYANALNLVEFYRKSLLPGHTLDNYDFHAEYVQKANLSWPDEKEDFFSEIIRAINTRAENGDF